MLIKTAEFVKSCPGLASCPCSEKPEYAFIGRSNVGKSSLINMISARKGLAMTSSKPGKTLLINYFDINNSWYLVDLPGYGFASVDKDTRARLKRMIEEYTVGRMQLTNLFVLLDCRLEPQKNDLDFINFLGEYFLLTIASDTSLLIVILRLKPEMLINNMIVGNDKIYKLIPLVPSNLVIAILLIKPSIFTIKLVKIIINVLIKKVLLFFLFIY